MCCNCLKCFASDVIWVLGLLVDSLPLCRGFWALSPPSTVLLLGDSLVLSALRPGAHHLFTSDRTCSPGPPQPASCLLCPKCLVTLGCPSTGRTMVVLWELGRGVCGGRGLSPAAAGSAHRHLHNTATSMWTPVRKSRKNPAQAEFYRTCDPNPSEMSVTAMHCYRSL